MGFFEFLNPFYTDYFFIISLVDSTITCISKIFPNNNSKPTNFIYRIELKNFAIDCFISEKSISCCPVCLLIHL